MNRITNLDCGASCHQVDQTAGRLSFGHKAKIREMSTTRIVKISIGDPVNCLLIRNRQIERCEFVSVASGFMPVS